MSTCRLLHGINHSSLQRTENSNSEEEEDVVGMSRARLGEGYRERHQLRKLSTYVFNQFEEANQRHRKDPVSEQEHV